MFYFGGAAKITRCFGSTRPFILPVFIYTIGCRVILAAQPIVANGRVETNTAD